MNAILAASLQSREQDDETGGCEAGQGKTELDMRRKSAGSSVSTLQLSHRSVSITHERPLVTRDAQKRVWCLWNHRSALPRTTVTSVFLLRSCTSLFLVSLSRPLFFLCFDVSVAEQLCWLTCNGTWAWWTAEKAAELATAQQASAPPTSLLFGHGHNTADPMYRKAPARDTRDNRRGARS